MGILGRFVSVLPGTASGLNDADRQPLAKALRDVRDGSASLAEFLRQRSLISANEGEALDRGRERVERSGLLQLMQETCLAINELASRTVVDSHSFLAPDPTLACFIFADGASEFTLRLELRGASPYLVFCERKWRDNVSNDFMRWAYRMVEVEPITITVKLVHEVRDERMTADDVRLWFFYLISGFDRAYTPRFRSSAG